MEGGVYDEQGEAEEIKEEIENGYFRPIFSGEIKVDIFNVIDSIDLQQEHISEPEDFLFDNNLLRNCLLFSSYFYDEWYIVDDAIAGKLGEVEKMEKDLDIFNVPKNTYLIFPGNSPLYHLYMLKTLLLKENKLKYKKFCRQIIQFPISEIDFYDEKAKSNLIDKVNKLNEIIQNPVNINNTKLMKESLDDWYKYSVTLANYEKNKEKQDKLLPQYFKNILEEHKIPKNSKFIYIDYISSGRLYKNISQSFKELGYNEEIVKYKIKHRSLDSTRCAEKINMSKIEKYLNGEFMLPHNYLKCNIILYIYECYLNDDENVKNEIEYIKETYMKYTHKKLVQYKGKYINISYMDDEYEGFAKITFLENVLLEEIYFSELKIEGEIIKINPFQIISIEEKNS